MRRVIDVAQHEWELEQGRKRTAAGMLRARERRRQDNLIALLAILILGAVTVFGGIAVVDFGPRLVAAIQHSLEKCS